MTIDVDLLNKITADLEDAIQRAKSRTQLDIKVSTTNVRADIMNMEKRFFTPDNLAVLKKIKIHIPEKHDLALMKAARNEPRDIIDITSLHAADKLDAGILLERFKNELLPLNSGDDNLLKQKFLEMIESLFGTELANQFESKLL